MREIHEYKDWWYSATAVFADTELLPHQLKNRQISWSIYLMTETKKYTIVLIFFALVGVQGRQNIISISMRPSVEG